MFRIEALILPAERREPMPGKREQSFFTGHPIPGVVQRIFVLPDLKQALLAAQFVVNVRGVT
ncbi:hypothetical protein D1872_348500 [compost metagenome]